MLGLALRRIAETRVPRYLPRGMAIISLALDSEIGLAKIVPSPTAALAARPRRRWLGDYVRSRLKPAKGAPTVPHYRIHHIGRDGHHSTPADIVECADEQEAIGKSAQAANGKAVELWQGSRLIVRFPQD
jgi:hypothetical protein